VTLILTRLDIQALMEAPDWLDAVEQGFRALAEGKAESPTPMHLQMEGGAFHAKGASLRSGRPCIAVKLNGNFPENPTLRALPTIQGAVLLCDGIDGRLLAILDSGEVTLRRTAAASALAARLLARRNSQSLMICGCGEQGLAHFEALRGLFPIRSCFAWDKDPGKAEAMAKRFDGVEAVSELAKAAQMSEIIVTCTSSGQAFLEDHHISPGTFIAAVGADSPAKSEIAPGLMARARIVVDSLDQCAAMGDLRLAIAAGTMGRNDVHAELAQIVTGARQGRTSDEEIFLFDSTGTAIADVASAAFVHQRAIAHGGFPLVALDSRR
jgi:ornithine cyclodeaminase/alanine dehydrogenase-like protein (mu-crystallin family)